MRTYKITIAVTDPDITEDKLRWLLEEAGAVLMVEERVDA